MKKILVFLLICGALCSAALAVFLATFDADRYRSRITAQLEQALGSPVQLEKISLGWQGGISLEAKGLAVYPDAEAIRAGKPAAEVERAGAQMSLLPLLRGNVQLASVRLFRPRVHLTREPGGRIRVTGSTPPPAPAQPRAVHKTARLLPLTIRLLEVEEGTVGWTDLNVQPPLDLTLQGLKLKAAVRGDRFILQELTGRIDAGTFSVSGLLKDLAAAPEADLNVSLDHVSLDSVVPRGAPSVPALHGILSVSAHLVGGLGWRKPNHGPPAGGPRSLAGKGRLRLEEVRLSRMNLLREIFDRITLIPGLTETLLAHLSESYRKKLLQPDTFFQPVDVSFLLSGGTASFENLQISTDFLELTGSGQAGAEGQLSVSAEVRLEPELSRAVTEAVDSMRFLQEKDGRIMIPVLIRARLPEIRVLPDLNNLAVRLLSRKGEELLEGLLRKL